MAATAVPTTFSSPLLLTDATSSSTIRRPFSPLAAAPAWTSPWYMGLSSPDEPAVGKATADIQAPPATLAPKP